MAQVIEIFRMSKTKSHLSCIVNIMVADDLVAQGARASAVMVLT